MDDATAPPSLSSEDEVKGSLAKVKQSLHQKRVGLVLLHIVLVGMCLLYNYFFVSFMSRLWSSIYLRSLRSDPGLLNQKSWSITIYGF